MRRASQKAPLHRGMLQDQTHEERRHMSKKAKYRDSHGLKNNSQPKQTEELPNAEQEEQAQTLNSSCVKRTAECEPQGKRLGVGESQGRPTTDDNYRPSLNQVTMAEQMAPVKNP